MRQPPQRLCERVGIARSPHNQAQCRSVERMLQIRHVALRHGFPVRAALPHVTNDTNNLHAVQRVEGTEDGPAQRIFVGKRFSDHCLIYHRDKRLSNVSLSLKSGPLFSGIPSAANVPGATTESATLGARLQPNNSAARQEGTCPYSDRQPWSGREQWVWRRNSGSQAVLSPPRKQPRTGRSV